jgi:hypothetical protein
MKQITLIVRQFGIGRRFANRLRILLQDEASVLDAIKAFDEELEKRDGQFPIKGFDSLLQIVYHLYAHRFYKQVAIQVHATSNQFLNIRENPEMPLPNEATVILIPEGGCSTDWEEPIKLEMQKE